MGGLVPTPGQTVGPFYGYALPFERGGELVGPTHPRAVRLHGTVTDGRGAPVPDALVEIWQADEDGRVAQRSGSLARDGWTFTGFGRVPVDDAGRYTFTTVEPGPTGEGRAAFFAVTVFARGLLDRLFTRAYLPGQDDLEHGLPSSLTDAERATLVCIRDGDRSLRFDIRLQGEDETVFLAYDAGPRDGGAAQDPPS